MVASDEQPSHPLSRYWNQRSKLQRAKQFCFTPSFQFHTDWCSLADGLQLICVPSIAPSTLWKMATILCCFGSRQELAHFQVGDERICCKMDVRIVCWVYPRNIWGFRQSMDYRVFWIEHTLILYHLRVENAQQHGRWRDLSQIYREIWLIALQERETLISSYQHYIIPWLKGKIHVVASPVHSSYVQDAQ